MSDGAKLNVRLFDKIWACGGPFKAEMFASGATVQATPRGEKLPEWAMLADGVAAGVDALTADWGSLGRVSTFGSVNICVLANHSTQLVAVGVGCGCKGVDVKTACTCTFG
jgi:hypothetical protein